MKSKKEGGKADFTPLVQMNLYQLLPLIIWGYLSPICKMT